MNLLLFVLYLPLAAFLLALLVPRGSVQASRLWALIASAANFVASLGLLIWFDRNTAGNSLGRTPSPGSNRLATAHVLQDFARHG